MVMVCGLCGFYFSSLQLTDPVSHCFCFDNNAAAGSLFAQFSKSIVLWRAMRAQNGLYKSSDCIGCAYKIQFKRKYGDRALLKGNFNPTDRACYCLV